MAVVLVVLQPFSLFSQPSVDCPEYSFCLEWDEENCAMEVRLHGVGDVPILGVDLRILFGPNAPQIDIPATLASFQSTDIAMHFAPQTNPSDPVLVSSQNVFIQFSPSGNPPLSPFTTDDDCLVLGTIYFDTVELECDDENFSFDYQLAGRDPLGPNIWVGTNFPFDWQPCYDYDLDCECLDCPEDWGLCILPDQDPCGNVIPVYLTGLEGEELAAIRFDMVFDPTMVIDEEATRASWFSSSLGSHNWDVKDLTVSHSSNATILTVFGANLLPGNNPTVLADPELLFNIHLVPQLGECYKFDENSISFQSLSGINIGETLQDSYLCNNFELTCGDFEVCFDKVELSGNIERPTVAGSCDEGIDFGFPEGRVKAIGDFCGYSYEFTTMTNDAGYFEIDVFEDGQFDIIPEYTEAHKYACGVNSIDVDIIRTVILGTAPCFPFSFSNIAADMNLNGTISTHDITYIERYILDLEYPVSGKWRFLPSTQYYSDFDTASCPNIHVLPYDTMLTYTSGSMFNNSYNFKAIKMGDVNGSCQQCLYGGTIQQLPQNLMVSAIYYPADDRLGIYLEDRVLEDVTVINLALDGGDGIDFGYDGIKKNVTDSYIRISGYGPLGASEGWVSLRENGVLIDKGDEIASFTVEDFRYTSEMTLTLGEIVSNGKLYELTLDRHEFEVIEAKVGKVDNMVSIAPNPGKDELRIELGQEWEHQSELRIVDMMGRAVGHHQLNAGQSVINTSSLVPGTYQLIISSSSSRITKTWVKVQ